MPRRLLHLRPWRRHSFVLAVAGGVYVSYGLAMTAFLSSRDRENGLTLATNIMPLEAWGLVWIGVGGLALASTRWPPQSETWGYGAMAGLSALWGSMYLLGMPFRDEAALSIPGVLVFYLLTFLWWAISGLMNPDDEVPHKPIVFDWTIYAPMHRERHKHLADPASTADHTEE